VIGRALEQSWTTTAVLAVLAALSIGSVVIGDRAFRGGWAAAAWIAWPGGASPFLIIGLVVWLVLLIPAARLEDTWTRRCAGLCLAGVAGGVIVQLLDDHVFNHAGTDNPLGIDIPFPIQDLLTSVGLLAVGAALLGALLTLPARIALARRG
jgi:hypothetical protein